MVGDFNYVTFKNFIYQLNSIDSETNILTGFTIYKLKESLIHQTTYTSHKYIFS